MIVQAPDGKTIDFGEMPPDQVTGAMQKLYPPTATANPNDDFTRPAKAFASNAIGALPDMFTAMPRMAGQAIAAGGRAIGMNPNLVDSANPFDWANKVPQLSQIARMGMDQAFPTAPAQTQGQRFAEGASNFAGSVVGGGLGANAIQGVVPQVAKMMIPRTLGDYAGTVGGTLGAGAGNAVFPDNPIAQAIMTMAGGVGAGGTAAAFGAGKNALVETAKPFTQGGREQIVGHAYNQAAQNPQEARFNMQTAPEYVPNSRPMAGSASQDYGLLALQKGLRNENGPRFADAESSQNAARNIMLNSMAKTPEDIMAAKTARDALTGPMREEAFANAQPQALSPEQAAYGSNGSPVIGKINQILNSPAGSRETVDRAATWVKNMIGKENDPEKLYEIRKDINDAIQGKFKDSEKSDFRLAGGALGDIKRSLDAQIESVAPGYRDYLSTYAEKSKPINQMETLQDVKSRVMLAAPDAKTGYDFMSQPKWSNAVQNPESRAELSKILAPEQLKNLDLITQDLDRGALVNNPAIRSLGSDTQRNQTMAQMLGSLATGRGLSKIPLAGKAFDWLQSMAQKDIDNLMVEAMLDPKLAVQLMKKASVPNIPSFSQALQRKAMQLGIPISLELQKKK